MEWYLICAAPGMLRNYLKTAWRNLWKRKTFTIINIAGLAIGMAACIVILLFVSYERNFDGMHTKNIYRLCEVQKPQGMVAPQNVALSMFPMGPTLRQEFPEVRNFTRVRQRDRYDLRYGEKNVFFDRVAFVDSTYLELFNFPLLAGSRKEALVKPNSAVLTPDAARRLFGHEDPIGKTVVHHLGDTTPFTITGIIDIPGNSHMQFDALFSFSSIYQPWMFTNWGGNWLVTYLELAPETNVAAMEKKFPAYLKRHLSEENYPNYELFLQPLPQVHAGSTNITHDYVNDRKFDRRHTYIFAVIAFIILVLACINFMNLSTARSAERSREVGVRKSIGARRYQLAGQFIAESVITALIAMCIALAAVKLVLPAVSAFADRTLELPLFERPLLLPGIIAATMLVGILAGLYPAVYLSSFEPVRVLKGSPVVGRNRSLLRNSLVVAQFAAAIFLMIATSFALQQLKFMQTRDRGFTVDQVLLLRLDPQTNPKYAAIKEEFLQHSFVEAASGSQQRLGANIHQGSVEFHGSGPVRSLVTSGVAVDRDFLRLYKIQLVAGSDFSKDKTGDGREYIINESLAKELLREDGRKDQSIASLIGSRFRLGGEDSTGYIRGVAKDFNFNSLHHKIETLTLYNVERYGFSELAVRIKGGHVKEALALAEDIWKRQAPTSLFSPAFLDQHFNALYHADQQVSRIVAVLAGLAIFISCLGLFGLASYAAERRTKEIGIRKVMGASVRNIVAMLSRDFIRLVLIAMVIAWPVAWLGVGQWLNDFAYRVPVTWWVFVVAGAGAVAIALFTVSFQALRAGRANPVNSLKMD
ncbi:ABC transporter permease [Chitinophaga lutea]